MAKKGSKKAQTKAERAASSKKNKDGSDDDANSSAAKPAASGPNGLCNLGNTCFLNSIMQCLNVSYTFSDKLLDMSQAGIGGLGTTVSGAFKGIRGLDASAKANKTFSPKPLLGQLTSKCPWYKGGKQQDAHEFLRTLLGLMSDELTVAERKEAKAKGDAAPPKPPGTPAGECEKSIWASFRGHLFSSVLCWNCERVSVRLDPFLDLSLEVPREGVQCGPMGISLDALASSSSSPSKKGTKKPKASTEVVQEKKTAEPDEHASDDSGQDDETIELLLKRSSPSESWGFRFSAAEESEKKLIVAEVIEDSIVDKWNLKRKSSGDDGMIVSKGDQIVRVGKAATDFDAMMKALAKDDAKLAIKVFRPSQVVTVVHENPAKPKETEELDLSDETGREIVDVVLKRSKASDSWGFEWSAKHESNEELVVAGIVDGSVVDNWNLKKRSMQDDEMIVREGDHIVRVGKGAEGFVAMRSAFEKDDVKLAIRISRPSTDGKKGDEKSEEEAGSSDEGENELLDLAFKRGSQDESWGFKWSTEDEEKEKYVVAGISEGSVIDKFNLKKQSMGDADMMVRKGDRIVRINKLAEDFAAMTLALSNDEKKLSVRISRTAAKAGGSKSVPKSAAKQGSDDEGELTADDLRAAYSHQAQELLSGLPADLKHFFGAEDIKPVGGGHRQLSDCMRRFTSVEALEDDFKPNYECSICSKASGEGKHSCKNAATKNGKTRTYASRRAWLWPDLPPLLTVQLKRFQRRGTKYEKSPDSVDVPATIDLSEYLLEGSQFSRLKPFLAPDSKLQLPSASSDVRPRYELYGVCVHLGSTLQSGHYIAYVNTGPSLAKEKWYNISDASVKKCTREDALKAEAYVAFYRREDLAASATTAAAGQASDEEDSDEEEDAGAAEEEAARAASSSDEADSRKKKKTKKSRKGD
eukprot:TRINITY_DN7418_c2_g1_i1.p1 TRINITY_DN7418_c2_g1~~TRINITY_DN7418_c2_g1_i1.p1  ORF type:complete len:924 (-),score=210.01 TRINITY_DN7418_c2_g1_i1:79-2850(-)